MVKKGNRQFYISHSIKPACAV